MRNLASVFGIHEMALDVIVNTPQRVKTHPYDNHVLYITRMLGPPEAVCAASLQLLVSHRACCLSTAAPRRTARAPQLQCSVSCLITTSAPRRQTRHVAYEHEQLSVIVGRNYVITFQEVQQHPSSVHCCTCLLHDAAVCVLSAVRRGPEPGAHAREEGFRAIAADGSAFLQRSAFLTWCFPHRRALTTWRTPSLTQSSMGALLPAPCERFADARGWLFSGTTPFSRRWVTSSTCSSSASSRTRPRPFCLGASSSLPVL
jgi:hypothetical protein